MKSGPTTVIDGFVITGGNADAAFSGKYSYENLILTRYEGGGIYLQQSSVLVNQVLLIANNVNYYGGGMIIKWDAQAPVSTSITNSTIVNNTTADNYGGGLADYGTNTYLKNVVFKNNKAYSGGAIHSEGYGALTIENCSFINHKATYPDSYGGALYLTRDFTIRNSLFQGNTVKHGFGGAIAVYSWGEPVSQTNVIENCIFDSNGGNVNGGASSGVYGTRAYEGGAIYLFSSKPLQIKENAV